MWIVTVYSKDYRCLSRIVFTDKTEAEDYYRWNEDEGYICDLNWENENVAVNNLRA